MMKRIRALITGNVQGVFFRATAKERAEQEGLSGWVRNLSDGRLEVVAEGHEASLERFIEFLKEGPPAARVEKVGIEWGDPQGEEGFMVR